MEKKWNGKRIVALIGVIVLLSMYLISLILAIMARPEAMAMFFGSVACTIFIPILIYAYMMIYKIFHKEDEGIPLRDLKKMNRRVEQGESLEKIKKELEEKAKRK